MAKIDIIQAQNPEDIGCVRELFEDYLRLLVEGYKIGGGCGDNTADLSDFPQSYKALFLARLGGDPVAACGVNHINIHDCELVKLFARPRARGHGLGQKLVRAVSAYARANGYARLVLSTEPVMRHAITLYRNCGFRDIENYADAPSACSRYMALDL